MEIRLLRALLLFTKALPVLTWKEAFEACFLEAPAPHLSFEVWVGEEKGVFTWNVLKAAPALVRIDIGYAGQTPGAIALQSITTALRNGALQNLQEVVLRYCDLSGGGVRDLTIALAGSGCAKPLTCLKFIHCNIDADGAQALADVLCQGTFPALNTLDLSANHFLTDGGVVALAEALLKAPQILLTHLSLSDVGMGDEGIAALASLVVQGRLQQLEESSLSRNDGVTKQGSIALAEAIGARGLPVLRALHLAALVRETDKETVRGVTTLVHAIIKGRPPLEQFTFDPAHRDTITDILEAAGWVGDVAMR